MSDTSAHAATSEAKSCATCGTSFGDNDDNRYKECRSCRMGGASEAPKVHQEATDWESRAETIPPEMAHSDTEPERQKYWCGVLETCPSHNVAAVVNFPYAEGRRSSDGEMITVFDNAVRGKIHSMSEKDVQLAKERIASRFIRWRGEGERRAGIIYSKHAAYGKTRQMRPGDEPLGKYVYMIRVDGNTLPDFGDQDPPTMVR